MSLGDIFRHISSKTGQILTKLGRGMGMGKERSYEFFGKIALEAPDKGQNTNLFHDECHTPIWSLPLYRFLQNLAEICESMCHI